jgi:hypothetical protein
MRSMFGRRGGSSGVVARTCRVICANQTPDHATIARFRARHEDAIAELFEEALLHGSPKQERLARLPACGALAAEGGSAGADSRLA